jgi:hypothetical protein
MRQSASMGGHIKLRRDKPYRPDFGGCGLPRHSPELVEGATAGAPPFLGYGYSLRLLSGLIEKLRAQPASGFIVSGDTIYDSRTDQIKKEAG